MAYTSDDQVYTSSNMQWPNPYAPNEGLYSSVMVPILSEASGEIESNGRPFVPSSQVPAPTYVLQDPERTYVNPKQYYRILKRRQVRALLAERKPREVINASNRNKKKHDSRVKHASKRPRKGGRFLSTSSAGGVEEVNENDAREKVQDHEQSDAGQS
jgi:hypothetical protein